MTENLKFSFTKKSYPKRVTSNPKYYNDHIKCRSEIALWKAVVLQALVDLKSKSKKKMAKINRIRSILWLNLRNKEFLVVCDYADLDPYYVWERAQEIKTNNPLV